MIRGARTFDGRPRFHSLDALRGIGALGIVTYHAYQNSRLGDYASFAYRDSWVNPIIRNLDFGLALFFSLSGFVLFLPWVARIVDGRRGSVRQYASRRFWRVYPLYAVILVLVWDFRFDNTSGQWSTLIEHLTFTQIYDNNRIFFIDGPAWSLAAEVHYYVGLGLIVAIVQALFMRRSRRTRILALAVPTTLIMFASLGAKAYWHFVQHVPNDSYVHLYSALARADVFAAGMLLALWWHLRGQHRPMSALRANVLLVFCALWFSALSWARVGFPGSGWIAEPRDILPVVETFYYPLAAVGIITLLVTCIQTAPTWWFTRVLGQRWLVFTGTISFSVYLLHEPLLIGLENLGLLNFTNTTWWPLSVAALIAVCLVAGRLGYVLVEKPSLRVPEMWARITVRNRSGSRFEVRRPMAPPDDVAAILAARMPQWPGSGLLLIAADANLGFGWDPVAAHRQQPDAVILFGGRQDELSALLMGSSAQEAQAVRARTVLDPRGELADAIGAGMLSSRGRVRSGLHLQPGYIRVSASGGMRYAADLLPDPAPVFNPGVERKIDELLARV